MTIEELRNMTDEGCKALLESMGKEKLASYLLELIEIINDPKAKEKWDALKKALETEKSDPGLKGSGIGDDRFFELFENLLADPSKQKEIVNALMK